jgi:hypothetical protein
LTIQRHKRRVLVLVCPQNDFHDRIPESGIHKNRIIPLSDDIKGMHAEVTEQSLINYTVICWFDSSVNEGLPQYPIGSRVGVKQSNNEIFYGQIVVSREKAFETTYGVLYDTNTPAMRNVETTGSLPVSGELSAELQLQE